MSKKPQSKTSAPKKPHVTEEVSELLPTTDNTDTKTEEIPQVVEVLADTPERTMHSEHGALYELDEAAQTLIAHFNPSWLPSIRAYAKSHGLSPQCPLALWSWLFKSWGAVLKT